MRTSGSRPSPRSPWIIAVSLLKASLHPWSRLVHLDVEEWSEDLLSHKEPAYRIQSPLLGVFFLLLAGSLWHKKLWRSNVGARPMRVDQSTLRSVGVREVLALVVTGGSHGSLLLISWPVRVHSATSSTSLGTIWTSLILTDWFNLSEMELDREPSSWPRSWDWQCHTILSPRLEMKCPTLHYIMKWDSSLLTVSNTWEQLRDNLAWCTLTLTLPSCFMYRAVLPCTS